LSRLSARNFDALKGLIRIPDRDLIYANVPKGNFKEKLSRVSVRASAASAFRRLVDWRSFPAKTVDNREEPTGANVSGDLHAQELSVAFSLHA
jgi:hypothetical protein